MNGYLLWKMAHIVSASVLFGTGLGIAFFAWFGYRRALKAGEIDGLRAVLRLTVVADACFTAPAVVFQAVSGFMLMSLDAWSWSSPWTLTVIGLFVLVGLLWLPVVAIQVRMSREAERAPSIASLSPGFHRSFVLWFVLGVPAFLLVLVIFFLMVGRPLPVT
ncbi:MAG TPA: DUF2269 domain-containing protein [Gammaproteobacteria bacterium]|nr:DUF2269 domain-containing protein [Gammaproteobacteria bacterium]